MQSRWKGTYAAASRTFLITSSCGIHCCFGGQLVVYMLTLEFVSFAIVVFILLVNVAYTITSYDAKYKLVTINMDFCNKLHLFLIYL